MNKFIAVKPSATYAAKTGGGTIAGTWEIDLLVEGTLAFLKSNGSLLAAGSSAISAVTDTPYLILARSMGANKTPITVEAIDPASLTVRKTAYKAPSKKKMAFGQYSNSAVDAACSLNLPDLIANGDSAGFVMVDVDLPVENINRYKIYEIDVVDSDVLTGTGTDNIIVKLVAKYNSDPYRVANATVISADGVNADGILFESIESGRNFEISKLSGILALATISSYKNKAGVFTSGFTTLTANNRGIGTYEQMLVLEKWGDAKLGRNNWQPDAVPLYTEVSQLDSSTVYTQYELAWVPPLNDSLIRTNGFVNHAVIAVKSTDATLIGVLDAFFAGRITTTPDLY